MSRSRERRAQVEPVAAVVAVLALCLALVAYGAVGESVVPTPGASAPADQVLDDAVDAATPPGSVVVSPSRLEAVAPAGYETGVRLVAGERTWTAGASDPPPEAASASRRVPVRVGPDDVVPGRLTVEVWP